MNELTTKLKAARKANVPLIAIRTPDPALTIKHIESELKSENIAIAQWDAVQGMTSRNVFAGPAVDVINEKSPPPIATGNPVDALSKCLKLPAKSILFFHNGHLYLDPTDQIAKLVIQGVWNLRDPFKKNFQTLILLVTEITLPKELMNDVLVLDEPLPDEAELTKIALRAFNGAGFKVPGKKLIPKIVNAISGLATLSAEQVVAMSLNAKTRNKINLEELWERKIQIIEQAPGLKVHRGGPRFEDIGGNHNIKNFLSKIVKGKKCPRVIVFIDEIEKAMAAAGSDSSGTTTDQLKVLLTEMQNNSWTGLILYGFSGTAKSELSKAFGNEAGCITVEADLGAMKSQWVGSSEAKVRGFVKTIKAVGNGHVFFMATCNNIDMFTRFPELRRRFRKGVFFCDLPNKAERDVIWKIFFKKFELDGNQPMPNDEGWSGDEIRGCCDNASELKISLLDSSKFLTIGSHAMGPRGVEEMRKAASGKFISALHPGVYHFTPPAITHDEEKTI